MPACSFTSTVERTYPRSIHTLLASMYVCIHVLKSLCSCSWACLFGHCLCFADVHWKLLCVSLYSACIRYTYACIHTLIHTCLIHTRLCTCAHTYRHTRQGARHLGSFHACAHYHLHVYAYIQAHTCNRVHTYTHLHAYTHSRTHHGALHLRGSHVSIHSRRHPHPCTST
jgi:hypothetical protein